MLWVVTWVLVICAAGGALLYLLGIWSALRHRRIASPPCDPATLPAVSLLKPIKGTEESLAGNLRSFFEQDYPGPFEIIFASTEPDDPGMAVARQLTRQYPDVPVRFVVSDDRFGLNPKVANLAGALSAASHDLVFQSDANVRVSPSYLRLVTAELLASDASLLTSMVVGMGEQSTGAALENLQLSAFIAAGMCTALHVGGVHCVVGKSMLFRRSELAEIGGLESVRDVLAEDFILGRSYERAGKRVVLSAHTVQNINRRMGVRKFLARHSRWLKMRAVIHVGGFVADVLANPVALLFFASLASGLEPWVVALTAIVALGKTASDGYLVRLSRREPMRLRHLILAPLKDVLMGLVWVHAIFSRSVEWRGTRLRLGRNSVLTPATGTLRQKPARPPVIAVDAKGLGRRPGRSAL